MRDFRYLHAADVHLDSPLYGLARYEGIPADEVRTATRAAFDNLVELAIAERVDFLIIAGDLYDGDWKHMGTGLYFAQAMGRLDRAGIPVFLLSGNHDAASVITRQIPWPANVKLFSSQRPQTHMLDELGVAIHGQSFATSAVTDNLVANYPGALPNLFNIGVLHTALTGAPDHAPYAPCDLADLRARGYDYWALGHVHARQMVATDPYVVYPGNLQGRTIRETGAKGATLVEVSDRQVQSATSVELDVLRWTRVEVDCTDVTSDSVHDRIRSALTTARASDSAGRPLIARIVLRGQSPAAGWLRDRAAELRDEVCAIATAISGELWIEKVITDVTAPAQPVAPANGLDFAEILDEARDDPELIEALSAEVAFFLPSARSSLGDAEEGEHRQWAEAGAWSKLLDLGAEALRARLVGEV